MYDILVGQNIIQKNLTEQLNLTNGAKNKYFLKYEIKLPEAEDMNLKTHDVHLLHPLPNI